MKKLPLLVVLLGAEFVALGQGYISPKFLQGYVNFANDPITRVSTNNGAGGIGWVTGAGNFYFALLVAPTTQTTIDASLAGWSFAAYGTNMAVAGHIYGDTTADGSGVPIPGYGATARANFAAVGWSANLGSDWVPVFHGRPTTLGPGSAATGTWTTYSGEGLPWYGVSGVAQSVLLSSPGGPVLLDVWFGGEWVD